MTSEIDKINLIEKNRNNKNVEIITKKSTKKEIAMNSELKPLLSNNDDPPSIPTSSPPSTPPKLPPINSFSHESTKEINGNLEPNETSNGDCIEMKLQSNENKEIESSVSENNTLNEASVASISTDSPPLSIMSSLENKSLLSDDKFISVNSITTDNEQKTKKEPTENQLNTRKSVDNTSDNLYNEDISNIIIAASTSSENDELALVKSKSLSINSFDSDTISIKFYDYLLELLKCPGCAQPMKNSMLCEAGHSCCQRCILILRKCPLCKEPFTDMRSLTLEALMAKAQFTCSNHLAGCKVRFPIELLDWHEKKCQYKTIKCFMGRVWGNCEWQGRDLLWKDHLESKHMDKVFSEEQIELSWDLNTRSIPLAGYYVFNWKKEVFNLYQIFDKKNGRCLWTIATCSISSQHKKEFTFAYEIEVYNKQDESKVLCQRFPCHNEQEDKDILQEGTCVAISVNDLSRFINQNERIINYRVRLFKLKAPPKQRLSIHSNNLPIDYKQVTNIGANMKGIPDEVIITREIKDNALVKTPQHKAIESNKTSDSDSDGTELTEFVNDLMQKKWMQKSLTTPNLNRRFWEENYDFNSSIGSLQSLQRNKETLIKENDNSSEQCQNSLHLEKRRKSASLKRFRQSFKNFRHFAESRFGGTKKPDE